MIWDDHLVDERPDGASLIYIDRHLVDEVDSPQAFAALRLAGLRVHAPDKTLLVVDHNVPTSDRRNPNPDPESAAQIAYLAENAKLFGLEYYDEFDRRQGICHVVGPEQGFTLPGTVIVCGDSHTTTHGAFGALAYGIGTSGGIGHALEFSGEAIRGLSMEGRMTVCNMSAEAGARTGIIAPDEKTYEFLKGRPKSPKGRTWEEAMRYWATLRSDDAAQFDREVMLSVNELPPLVTWGTSPEQVVSITGRVPKPAEIADESRRHAAERSLAYMGLEG